MELWNFRSSSFSLPGAKAPKGISSAQLENSLQMEQEDQHPLTGQRTANFRLLANQ